MLSLTWAQVNAWRLAQHSLLERAGRDEFLDVVARLGGLHAQLMSAAELQLWARVRGLAPSDVQDALWRDRLLVKTWAMRGTLHLLPAHEFPLAIGALSALTHFRRGSWLKYHGVTLDELEAILEGVRATLGGTGITREQLADALVVHTGNAHVRELLLSGWGALLKPAAFQGSLCFGPNQGQNVTFVRPDRWIGAWEPVEPEVALAEIARRFLAVYGPATVEEFARWWGFEPSRARKIFRALDGEIEMVSVEGWEAWALAASLEPMQTLQASHTVRLLPHFDPYVIAVARHSQYLLPEVHKGRVYRPQGWISPVVLVDGRIAGVWEHDRQRARAAVAVEMLVPPAPTLRDEIEAEAQRLGNFWETTVRVSLS